MNPSQSQQLTPAQLNQVARSLIKGRSVHMEQLIFSQTYGAAANLTDVSAAQPVINVIPRNVGLIKGFWVQAIATINNQSSGAITVNPTDFNGANIFSQIQFNDLNNNTRIQTTGWHINMIDSIKARRPFATSLVNATGIDSPVNYGSNYTPSGTPNFNSPTGPILSTTQGTVTMWFWIPLAYSDDDLRGAVYANVVNATMQLNLTVNPRSAVATATDSTNAIVIGAGAGSVAGVVMSALTVNVYQSYLDQLPTGQGGVILPVLDLATIYELKNTTMTAIVQSQDFPVQYANFRDFLSTVAIYVNTASTGARVGGTDIAYWALQSANFTNIWKKTPGLIATQWRNHLQADPPPGVYYFGSRNKPISTVQYGNMELVLNASTAGTGAYLQMAYEDFALVQTLSMAGSLAAS